MRTKLAVAAMVVIAVALTILLFRDPQTPSTGAGSPEVTGDDPRAETASETDRDLAPGETGEADVVDQQTTRTGQRAQGTENVTEQAVEAHDFTFFGRVVGEDGTRVAGAQVILGGAESREQPTDQDGAFRFSGLEPGTYGYLAMAQGAISIVSRWDMPRFSLSEEIRSVGPMTLTLLPAHELVLAVVDGQTDQPIVGAEVTMTRSGLPPRYTDEAGRINLFLSPEIWDVTVTAEGYAREARALDLANLEQHTYTIPLEPGGVVAGTVTDSEGAALAGVSVSVNGTTRISTTSEEDGSYRLENLVLGGSYRLFGGKEGYRSHRDGPFELTGRDPLIRDLILTREHKDEVTVRGTVFDPDGTPIPAAEIYARWERDPVTTTGSDGRYRIEVEAAPQYMFSAKAKGFAPAGVSRRKKTDTTDIEVNFILEPGHNLAGRVVDREDQGIPDVNIAATAKGVFLRSGVASTKTDSNGYFQLEDLNEEVGLSLTKTGFTAKHIDAPGLDRDDAVFVMDPNGAISGRVVDARSGRAIPAFNVKVKSGRNNHLWATEGIDFQSPEGAFTVAPLRMEERTLVIEAEGYAPEIFTEVSVTDGAEDRVFELGASQTTLAGRVIDGSGRGIAGARVHAFVHAKGSKVQGPMWRFDGLAGFSREALASFQTLSDTDGGFQIEGIDPSNRVDLFTEADGWASKHLEDVCEKPEETWQRLRVQLVEASHIEVLVNREAFPGDLRISIMNKFPIPYELGPEEDRWKSKPLTPGYYQLMLHGAGHPRQIFESENVDLPPGETLTLEWGFTRGFRVSGIALAGGEPLNQQMLVLRTEDRGLPGQRALTDQNGNFELERVKPGRYHLALIPGSDYYTGSAAKNNRVTIEVVDSDIEGTFELGRHGSLYGRIGMFDFQSLQLSGRVDGKPFMRTLSVSPGTPFRFEQVPPGTYNLGSQTNFTDLDLLVSDIVMPEDGSDLDLGLIEPKPKGSVRLLFRSDEEIDCGGMLLFFAGDRRGESLSFSDSQTRRPYEKGLAEVVFEGIPVGLWTLQPFMGCVSLSPSQALVRIDEARVAEVIFEHRTATDLYLYMSGVTGGSGNGIATAHLIHESTGRLVEPQRVDVESFTLPDTARYTLFSNSFVVARGLEEGAWNVVLTSESNLTKTFEVVLTLDEAVSKEISFYSD